MRPGGEGFQVALSDLQSHPATDRESETQRMTLQGEDHITVFRNRVRKQLFPIQHTLQLSPAQVNDPLCRQSAKDLDHPCSGFGVFPHPLETFHPAGKHLVERHGIQVRGSFQKPPASAFLQHQVIVEGRCRDAESILQVRKDPLPILIFCRPWP